MLYKKTMEESKVDGGFVDFSGITDRVERWYRYDNSTRLTMMIACTQHSIHRVHSAVAVAHSMIRATVQFFS